MPPYAVCAHVRRETTNALSDVCEYPQRGEERQCSTGDRASIPDSAHQDTGIWRRRVRRVIGYRLADEVRHRAASLILRQVGCTGRVPELSRRRQGRLHHGEGERRFRRGAAALDVRPFLAWVGSNVIPGPGVTVSSKVSRTWILSSSRQVSDAPRRAVGRRRDDRRRAPGQQAQPKTRSARSGVSRSTAGRNVAIRDFSQPDSVCRNGTPNKDRVHLIAHRIAFDRPTQADPHDRDGIPEEKA